MEAGREMGSQGKWQEELVRIPKNTNRRGTCSQLIVPEVLVEYGDLIVMVGEGAQK